MKRKRTIKLLFLSMLSISLLAIAAACGGEENTETSSGTNVSDTSSSSRPDSSSDSMEEQVTDYMLDEERKYTGTLVDGKPEGEGTLEWVLTNCAYTGEFSNGVYEGKGVFEWNSTGDKLEGIFSCGTPITGKYTYANTMSYEGEFNTEWKFEGEGIFDWNTYNADGSVKAYGWKYEGEFKNGSPEGCRGKVTFNQEGKGEGVYWFEGEMSGFPEVKKGQQGRGYIVYPDKSTYEGGIYYTSEGEWIRYGEGTQNFFYTTFTGASAGGEASDKIYCYVGEFDGRNYSWMYGNGVMYFSDISGNPTGYIKGTWDGLIRVGPYTAPWAEEQLLDRWKDTEELTYTDGYLSLFNEYMDKYGETDMADKLLMLGDSQFSKECFSQATDLFADEFSAVNIAIGGTTSAWWRDMLDELILGAPKYILVHVGGNDIRTGTPLETAVRDTKNLIDELAVKYPRAEIFYVSGIVGAFDYEQAFDEKLISLNDQMEEYAEESGNFEYIDVFSVLYSVENKSNIYDERFGYLQEDLFTDRLYLTKAAYDLWGNAIKQSLLQFTNGK